MAYFGKSRFLSSRKSLMHVKFPPHLMTCQVPPVNWKAWTLWRYASIGATLRAKSACRPRQMACMAPAGLAPLDQDNRRISVVREQHRNLLSDCIHVDLAQTQSDSANGQLPTPNSNLSRHESCSITSLCPQRSRRAPDFRHPRRLCIAILQSDRGFVDLAAVHPES